MNNFVVCIGWQFSACVYILCEKMGQEGTNNWNAVVFFMTAHFGYKHACICSICDMVTYVYGDGAYIWYK